jgi:glutaminyl-peptide cyclotransferase
MCPAGAGDVTPRGGVERLTVQVIEALPHDADAFTQGLLLHDGYLYESTGLYGESTVRRVEPDTGTVIESVDLPSEQFGEGLALAGDRLYQMTWQEQTVHTYDVDGLRPLGDHTYDGEGWGLCYDGERLVMSDGSSTLWFRDPDTFNAIGQVQVTMDSSPVARLNELECVGDAVYANVWMTDQILKIDPSTGDVRAVVDASGLLPRGALLNRDPRDAVLNGIAYDSDRQVFYVGGKWWPTLFEACFVPESDAGL